MATNRPKLDDLGIIITVPQRGRRAMSEDRSDLHGRGDGGRAKRSKPRPDDRGDSGGGLAKAARIAAKHPEVMVKVTSCSRGQKQLREHLNYITRNGKLVAETPNGEVAGRKEVAQTAEAWWNNRGEGTGQRREKTRESFNVTFKLPAGTDRSELLAEAKSYLDASEHNPRRLLTEHRSKNADEMTINLSLPLDAATDEDMYALQNFIRSRCGVERCKVRELNPGSKESVNFVLSMPEGTDREKFVAGARLFVERTFGQNHDYLMAEHRDTGHPHVHVAVRSLGNDGKRLRHEKEDLREFREALAFHLRAQGLEAEASPRRTRGVVQKSKSQAIYQLDRRGASSVQLAKVEAAVREIAKGAEEGKYPWENESLQRQRQVRSSWARLAEQLHEEGGRERGIAVAIRSFLADMPPVETERQKMRRLAMEQLAPRSAAQPAPAKQRGRDDANEQDL